MAKRKIRELPTGVHDFPTLIGDKENKYVDGTLREKVKAFGAMQGWDFATAKAKLLEWYDGYRFSPKSEAKVCNPVSLGKALEQARTKDYAGPWLDGKTPVFLVGVNYDPAKRGIDDPLVAKA